MGQKTRFQLGLKQRIKRTKKRKKLVARGQKLEEFYYGGYYLKPKNG